MIFCIKVTSLISGIGAIQLFYPQLATLLTCVLVLTTLCLGNMFCKSCNKIWAYWGFFCFVGCTTMMLLV